MPRILWLSFLLPGLLLTACPSATTPAEPAKPLEPVALDANAKMVAGQTVYVPVYSHIYTWEQNRTMDLTATLSVRNTASEHPIILVAVKYYNSDGELVRNYLEQPSQLGPLASTNFVVNQADTAGGSGAAFLVEWVTPQPVSDPIIEAIMISAVGNQGISFISTGRVIKRSPVDN